MIYKMDVIFQSVTLHSKVNALVSPQALYITSVARNCSWLAGIPTAMQLNEYRCLSYAKKTVQTFFITKIPGVPNKKKTYIKCWYIKGN
jgi:hypothetical protein